jgi:GAF domain-containing protein
MAITQPAVRTTLLEPTPPPGDVVDLAAALDSIVHGMRLLAPGTHVGISVANSAGTFDTVAGTGPLVFALDAIQYHLDEGPCLTAIREDHTVIIDDAESEHRWASFMPRAADLGLRSYLGVSITVDDRPVGGLNLYSTTRTHLDADRLAHAKLFAAQAALAMACAHRETNLRQALQTSRTIGKAIGLVMERFDLDDEEAFAYLARLSHRTNIKLREIAAHLVRQSNDLRHCASAAQPPGEPGDPPAMG